MQTVTFMSRLYEVSPHVEARVVFQQVKQSDKGVVCRKEPSVSVSPCLRQVALAKRTAYKMETRVFLSQLLFPGRGVDGVHMGGGGFRLLWGSCHVVVIYIMPYAMLHKIHPSKSKQTKLLSVSVS